MEKALNHTLNIVIADDDSDDHFIMQKAIWDSNPHHKITSVYNGLQLLEYLLCKGAYANRHETTPDCVFLDIHMPLLSGPDVLAMIKKDPELKHIPVYILSTVSCPAEKKRLLEMGASGFYVKSSQHQNLRRIIGQVLLEIPPAAAHRLS